MLCAFAGPPRIVRLHGRGQVLAASDACFAQLLARCELAELMVPEARMRGRKRSFAWAENRLWTTTSATRNAHSIDGLPALEL